MGTARLVDFYSKLNVFLEQSQSLDFKWGKTDCCQWIRTYLINVAGYDIPDELNANYRTQLGAYRSIKKLGFENIESIIDTILPRKLLGYSNRGDIMMKDSGLGICNGQFSFFLGIDQPITRINTLDCDMCWSIGSCLK